MKKKMMEFLKKKLINKYQGTVITYVVTASVTFLIAKFATAPEWLQGIITSVLDGLSDGQITELNPVTLTAALTPIVASAVQWGINISQAKAVEKIQEANGEEVDGWAGEKTVEAASPSPVALPD